MSVRTSLETPGEAAQRPEGNGLVIPLTAEHQVALRSAGTQGSITLVTSTGQHIVNIDVSAEGIALRAGTLTLTWDEAGGLRLEVDRLTLVGSKEVAIETEGDLRLSAGGRMILTATDQVIAATLGDVQIRANDNVAVAGEKILLNS